MSMKSLAVAAAATIALSGAPDTSKANNSGGENLKQSSTVTQTGNTYKDRVDEVMESKKISDLTPEKLNILKQYLSLKVKCEALSDENAECGGIELNLSDDDKMRVGASGFYYESSYGIDYYTLAQKNADIANIFVVGEDEIVNNPKVKPKRLQRILERYESALAEVFDGDGKYEAGTERFLKKYTPNTFETLLDLEGDLRAVNEARKRQNIAKERSLAAKERSSAAKEESSNIKINIEKENRKQEELLETQRQISILQKKFNALQ